MGFQNVLDDVNQLHAALKWPEVSKDLYGTMTCWNARRDAIDYVKQNNIDLKTWFHKDTPHAVREILEELISTRDKVRLWLGDTATGESWMEEHQTTGRIGRSMGPMKVPLLIEDGEDGGGAILTHCIVQIRRESNGEILYMHEKFHVPELHIRRFDGHDSKATGLRWETYYCRGDQKTYSRHYTYSDACALIAWFHGDDIKKVLDSED